MKSKNTWSAEGLGGGGGGTTTEETEERDDDLDVDLDLLAFFDFLDFPDLLDLRLPDFLRANEATGTEPNSPQNSRSSQYTSRNSHQGCHRVGR